MPTKRRTYNTRLIRRHHAYYVHEAAALFDTHKNTVHNWMKLGLTTIDKKRPLMIHGSDLAQFLDQRQKSRKQTCKSDEFFCCKCRAPRKAWQGVIDLTKLMRGGWLAKAICIDCRTTVQRIYGVKKLRELPAMFAIQTVNGEHISESSNPLVICDFNKGD